MNTNILDNFNDNNNSQQCYYCGQWINYNDLIDGCCPVCGNYLY